MEVVIPDLGDFEEVDVIDILVSVGDEVLVETPLMTLESDKATMDIPSPVGGKISKILASIGDKVCTNSRVFEIEEREGSDLSANQENDPIDIEEERILPNNPTENTVEIRVPDIGDFDDVDIIDILVSEGDRVQKEQPIITLESDKATMDLPSPENGVIKKICVSLGDKVGEGDLISILTSSDGQARSLGESSPPSITETIEQAEDDRDDSTAFIPATKSEEKTETIAHASPSVRKFARELGVDIANIMGSGKKSRILHVDVQTYVKKQMQEKDQGNSGFFGLPEIPEIDYSQFGEVEKVALTKIQQLTGENLHRSWITAPHVFQMDEADITELERFRKSQVEESGEQGVKLTLLSFIVKACANTLKHYPRFNSSLNLDGISITQKKYINIGIAVNTPRGLVVPVIRNVEGKGVTEIAKSIQDLANKARTNKITLQDLQGGSFTISNLGGISGTNFTPVINVPEVAILGISPSRTTPVWVNGNFVPKLMLPVTLSYDHRVIDGVAGAEFTSYFTETLGDIRQALM